MSGTPGPWKHVGSGYITDRIGHTVGSAFMTSDAVLAAQAPQMLAVLRSCKRALEVSSASGNCPDWSVTVGEIEEILRQVK